MPEYFDIVDENNRIIGRAARQECHGNPALIHRTAHVLVFDSFGRLYLQKRGKNKDIQPGKWDTSVGGHLDAGEEPLQAALRETREELGIILTAEDLEFLYTYPLRNEIESENVTTYRITYDGSVFPDAGEIEKGRFMDPDEIEKRLRTGFFTPNFEEEWSYYKVWKEEKGRKEK